MNEKVQGEWGPSVTYSVSNIRKKWLGQSVVQATVDELVELVQTQVHNLHANPTITFPEQSAIETNNERTIVGTHHHVQIHQQLFLLAFVNRRSNSFDRHYFARRSVQHAVHGGERTFANLSLVSQVVWTELVLSAVRELQRAGGILLRTQAFTATNKHKTSFDFIWLNNTRCCVARGNGGKSDLPNRWLILFNAFYCFSADNGLTDNSTEFYRKS